MFSALLKKSDDAHARHSSKENVKVAREEFAENEKHKQMLAEKHRAEMAKLGVSMSTHGGSNRCTGSGAPIHEAHVQCTSLSRAKLNKAVTNISNAHDSNKYATFGSFSISPASAETLQGSMLSIEGVPLTFPITTEAATQLESHLKTKRKGKTKKVLDLEQASRIREVDPSLISFDTVGAVDAQAKGGGEMDDMWYEHLHAQAMVALKDLLFAGSFLKPPSPTAMNVAEPVEPAGAPSNAFSVQLELHNALLLSAGGSARLVDGFCNVRGKSSTLFTFLYYQICV